MIYREDVAVEFGKLLIETAEEMGAPEFALTLAEGGPVPSRMNSLADQWERHGFDYSEHAGTIRLLADQIAAALSE